MKETECSMEGSWSQVVFMKYDGIFSNPIKYIIMLDDYASIYELRECFNSQYELVNYC